MKKKLEAEQALQEIHTWMSESNQFKGISGLAGMLAGLLALLYLAICLGLAKAMNRSFNLDALAQSPAGSWLGLGFLLLLAACLGIGWVMVYRKRRGAQALSAEKSARALMEMVGLGGLVCLIWLAKEEFQWLAGSSLLFYGLGLYTLSQHSLKSLKTMGMLMMALGLLALGFPEYDLYLWALGFGGLHLVFGGMIYKQFGL